MLFVRDLDRRGGEMKLEKWLMGIVIAVLVFGNPIGRQIVLWILPMGSGIDDLIFLVLLALAVPVGLVYWRRKHNEKENDEHKK